MDNTQTAKQTVQNMIEKDGLDVSRNMKTAITMCIKRILDHTQDDSLSVAFVSGRRAVEIMVDEEGLDASDSTLLKLEKRMDEVLGNEEVHSNDCFATAQSIVDQFIDDGLNTDALMHKKMETVIQRALQEQVEKTKQSCVNALKQCPDMNEMTETDLVWIDLEDAVEACNKV